MKARAVGALHNVSSDVDSIRIIRRRGGIKWLIRLLHHSQPCVCGSAAGALQNVSREVASRLLIRDSDAVKCLIRLLQSTEVQTQVTYVHESLGPKPNFLTRHYHTNLSSRSSLQVWWAKVNEYRPLYASKMVPLYLKVRLIFMFQLRAWTRSHVKCDVYKFDIKFLGLNLRTEKKGIRRKQAPTF